MLDYFHRQFSEKVEEAAAVEFYMDYFRLNDPAGRKAEGRIWRKWRFWRFQGWALLAAVVPVEVGNFLSVKSYLS